jgi:hypothetical protein
MTTLRLRSISRGLGLNPRRRAAPGAGSGPPGDSEAPSVPESLVAAAVSPSQIDLIWAASTDGIAVTGYNIYRDDVLIDTSPTNSYSDTGLDPGTEYDYEVSAFDAASNESARSAPDSATTHHVIVPDGLVAEWRFDDGAGQVLTDYKGGFHGTLGATSGAAADDPTWTAQGLSFNGDFVSIPTLPAIYGIDVVFKPTSAVTTSSARMDLLSNINDSGLTLGPCTGNLSNEFITIKQEPAAGYSTAHRRARTQAGGSISNSSWHLLQCDVRAATQYWNIVLDGTEIDNATVNTPTQFLSGFWTMGKAAHASAQFYNGEVAYVIFYGSARTNEQQAQNRQVLKSILTSRGITLP